MNFDHSQNLILPVALEAVCDLEVYIYYDDSTSETTLPYEQFIKMINNKILLQSFKEEIDHDIDGTVDFVIRRVPCPVYGTRTIVINVFNKQGSFVLDGKQYLLD